MVNLRSIIISNGVGVYLLLMLQYVSRTRIRRRQIEDRIFSFLVVGVLLSCIMEAFSYLIDGKVFPASRFLNYVANTYLFTINLILPFFVLVYIDLGLYGDVKRIWKHYKPQIVIGLVMLVVNIVNFFIPVTYYITEQNVYERRPLSYVYYFIILYYCISALVVTRHYNRRNGAKAFLSINLFLIPILIGAALQFMFYGLSLAWLSAAIGLIGLFMMQQNEIAFIDPLVDTYNRQYLNHITSGWISRQISFSGVMVDVDHFKDINDRYGHSEGDRALKTVTDILKQARQDNEWVFRFAGDEFIILKMTRLRDDMRDYISRVQDSLDAYNRADHPYPLSLSFGASYYDAESSGNIDAFMKEMDDRMYEMKAGHHGRNAGGEAAHDDRNAG